MEAAHQPRLAAWRGEVGYVAAAASSPVPNGEAGCSAGMIEMYIFICIVRPMNFTWRSSKRASNLKKHGFDFADAEQVFSGPTITNEDARDYGGEQRFNTTGFLGTAIVTITHTETDEAIHIISMRKAEAHEIETLSQYL